MAKKDNLCCVDCDKPIDRSSWCDKCHYGPVCPDCKLAHVCREEPQQEADEDAFNELMDEDEEETFEEDDD